VSRESPSFAPGAVIRTFQRTVPAPPTLSYQWCEGLRFPEGDLSPSSAVCESRWRRTWRRRAPCNASAAIASDIRSVTADTCPGASPVGALTSLVCAQSLGGSPSAAAVGATTRRTTGVALNGKRRRRLFKNGRLVRAQQAKISLRANLTRKQSRSSHLRGRWNLVRGGITSYERGTLSMPHLLPLLLNPSILNARSHKSL
jgi:hypothetical protein